MSNALLSLNNITTGYGDKVVLKDISLTIEEKDFIIINGPNGGGKTTLLKTIAGLIAPKSGTITHDERLITGYLPQYRGIDRDFPITVEETVLSGLICRKSVWSSFTKAHKQKVKDLLETFHLADLGKRPINTLSGGQWQRALLARSLASNPNLWLLDEPDTHLDAESQDYLHKRIAMEVGQRAVVVVTHNPEHLQHIPNQHVWHVENHIITE